MRYFKLDDVEHKSMVVRAEGDIQFLYENGDWVRSGIMLNYFSDESDCYDMYFEITESEAMRLIRCDFITIALEIAKRVHKDQIDKGGNPYIDHPLTVANMVQDENEKVVAILHDVVEDSEITLADLKQYGFCDEVLKAVEIITKKKDDDYGEYLKRIKQNPIARKVKLADLTHNMDATRLKSVNAVRMEKYKSAYKFLKEE